MPKLFVRSFGCQMNADDAARMSAQLAAEGYEEAEGAADADVVLLNTCHVREKAAERVYSEVGRLRALKAARPGLRVVVAGCVAQAEGREVLARAPLVDVVVGPQAAHRLPDLLREAARGRRVVDTEMPLESKFDRMPSPRSGRVAAFLTVQEGCDRFCSFCVVPYTRGAEQSRPLARLMAEARALVEAGARELTLLGQNVNAWHGLREDGEEGRLADLLAALARVDGLERLRYTTSHPRDMDDALIALHGTEPKLMPYLHLPVQAGSDRVLKAMNRGHTAEAYLALVARLRGARPDLHLGTDLIAGFPGETEREFGDTLALVEAVGFARSFAFAYSPRPGTPAARRLPVPPEEAHDRLLRLQALLARLDAAALAAQVGGTARVLFEGPGRHPGQMTGRSEHHLPVHVPGSPGLRGEVRAVRVLAAGAGSLSGEVAA